MQEIAVEFVYSLKTRRWFNSHAKCTVQVSPGLRTLLPALRTSYGRYWIQKICHYCLQGKKFFIFCCLEGKKTRPRFLALTNFINCLPPEKPCDTAFIPSVVKPKFGGCKIRSMRSRVVFFCAMTSCKTHMDEIERFQENFNMQCKWEDSLVIAF